MRTGKSAEHAAQNRRNPFHALGIFTGRAQRFGRFSGSADPEPHRRAVYKQPHHNDEQPGHIDKDGMSAQDLSDKRNPVDQRAPYIGKARNLIAGRAGQPEDLTRKERGETERESAERGKRDRRCAPKRTSTPLSAITSTLCFVKNVFMAVCLLSAIRS